MGGRSRNAFGSCPTRFCRLQQGSLYPALQRLERQGWIDAEWGASENNRRARFYRLTKAGRKRLEQEEVAWVRLSGAIGLVLRKA